MPLQQGVLKEVTMVVTNYVVGVLDRQTGRCGRRGAVYSNANS